MREVSVLKRIVAIALLSFGASVAHAGPDSDALAKCLVDSTSKDDRVALVHWMFAAAAAHPAVASIADVSAEEMAASNKAVANLFTKLLTVSCKDQAKKAAASDGMQQAIQYGFAVLGQTAGSELFDHPDVSRAMAGLLTSIDPKAFESFFAKCGTTAGAALAGEGFSIARGTDKKA